MINALTLTNRKLSIFLDLDGNEVTANYSTFYISDEGDNYRLTVCVISIMYQKLHILFSNAVFVLGQLDLVFRTRVKVHKMLVVIKLNKL